jgi:hypothetical protein
MGQVCVLSIFNIKNVFSLYVECVLSAFNLIFSLYVQFIFLYLRPPWARYVFSLYLILRMCSLYM